MAKAEYKSAIRSRRMIQRALVELLQEKELDKITVTDIVTRADINRGTFYAHYADISGVLDSIMENVCQTIREALEKQPLWAKAPDARIVLQHLQRMLESDPEFYRNAIRCCFSKRMRKVFKKNEKSMLQFCNKNSKKKRAFTMG